MLREFLESYGYYNLLPPLSNCIQIIPKFRKYLPVGVSAALDIIFPLLLPIDPLVGQNHRARLDASMCRKIIRLIRELIKLLKERKSAEYKRKLSDCYSKPKRYEAKQAKKLNGFFKVFLKNTINLHVTVPPALIDY
jgi:hypothetical protein